MMMKFRQRNEVNAGTMADIAFLLLIFFLVTTTILNDQGIMTRLPPYVEEEISVQYDKEYVLNILVNANDEIMFEQQVLDAASVGEKAKEFINARAKSNESNKTIVSLSCSRQASYSTYIEIYDQLKHAYYQLWDQAAHDKFGKSYTRLAKMDQKIIRNIIPLVISEAEVKNKS